VLAKTGVDLQVPTFTTPGTHIEEPRRAAELARMVNDAYAKIVAQRAAHFTALATLPLNDPTASVEEFDRALSQLGLRGAMLFSNINGMALADESYWPLYEIASDKNAVLYIHPTNPLGVEAMTEFWLMPLVGFLMDTTLAAAKLVFAGVPKRFPGIRWVLCHLGGAIPFLVERLDRGFEAFKECRREIDQPPSEYLRHFYFDTVNFNPAALRLAIDFAGVDHILAGSDYPHQIGSLQKMLASIDVLDLAADDKAKILGGNAATLLNI
jgi:aminocarboxymuconate-semialdehyde decarboxylase